MSVVRSSPRKLTRQDRSRATVERILEAGARVLIAYGYDGASTNRIARAAGVSPGSLYQYFSDKDGITAAVVDRLAEDISATSPLPSAACRDAQRGRHASGAHHPGKCP